MVVLAFLSVDLVESVYLVFVDLVVNCIREQIKTHKILQSNNFKTMYTPFLFLFYLPRPQVILKGQRHPPELSIAEEEIVGSLSQLKHPLMCQLPLPWNWKEENELISCDQFFIEYHFILKDMLRSVYFEFKIEAVYCKIAKCMKLENTFEKTFEMYIPSRT